MRLIMSRFTISDIQLIAKSLGGKCFSKEYIDDETLMSWMCRKGHTWDAAYRVIRQGGWCRQCALHQKSEEVVSALKAIARQRGGLCLSTEYKNRKTKMLFQCKEGHQWLANPGDVRDSH